LSSRKKKVGYLLQGKEGERERECLYFGGRKSMQRISIGECRAPEPMKLAYQNRENTEGHRKHEDEKGGGNWAEASVNTAQ